jgi:hypothetical protein
MSFTMTDTEKAYPPPWDLIGEGFILPFWAKEKEAQAWVSEEERKDYLGGLGAIMLVNYHTSNVGPYFELLFIPGDFRHPAGTYKKITKIYVSSQLSIKEGRKNWAIPKEFADFEWKRQGDLTLVRAWNSEGSMKVGLEKHFIPFPISTALAPFSLLQKGENCFLKTKFIGNGMGKLVSLESWESEGNFFPNIGDVSKFRMPAVGISPFSLVFPTPIRIES